MRRRLPFATPLVLLAALELAGCGGAEDASGLVEVNPPTAHVAPLGSVAFTATVSGEAPAAVSAGVTWSVREVGGGTIDASGLYTAPGATGTFQVVATSVADPTKSGSASVVVGSSAPSGIIPADLRTTWNPGIPGGIPSVTSVHTTIDAGTYGNGTTDAATAINDAIQAAGNAASDGNRQVVYLPPGVYRLNRALRLDRSNVVLRGAGPGQTKIRLDTSSNVEAIGVGMKWTYTGLWDVVGTVPKGATSLTVSNASSIQVGDVLQIDQRDGPYVWRYDAVYEKRQPVTDSHGPAHDGVWRSVGSQIEVVGKSGNTLTLRDPIHLAFEESLRPQVFKTATARAGEPGTKYVGIEDLYVTGGRSNMISFVNVAYGWVKNVESDGNPATSNAAGYTRGGMTGRHVNLMHAYRCVVRDSYFHHARSIVQGGGAYGIASSDYSSENLIENNIVVNLNKPIVLNVSGGGNVIAYNFVDNAMIEGTDWLESAIDGCHQSFSHSDLFEGNQAPNIGSDSTHGNAGWHVFFRNYATGRNSIQAPGGNRRAAGADANSGVHVFVGNVLTAYGSSPYYQATPASQPSGSPVFRLGDNGNGGQGGAWDDGTALANAYRHGNWDNATNGLVWEPSNPERTLPDSLYLTAKPAFFGANPWPWVNPQGNPRTLVLPAKQRFDAMQ